MMGLSKKCAHGERAGPAPRFACGAGPSQEGSLEWSPERRRRLHPGRPAALHVVNAVTHVDARLHGGAKQPGRDEKGLGVRFRVGDVIRRDDDVHGIHEPQKPKPPLGPGSLLAGDQPGLEPSRPNRLHHFDRPRIGADSGVVMRDVEVAVGPDQLVQEDRIAGPFAELDSEGRADAGQPVFVGLGRQPVSGQGVMIAVDDQPNRVEEGSVEIEEDGAKGCP